MFAFVVGNNTPHRFFRPALLLVTLAALGLRLCRLDAESLWMDELVTAETYPLPLSQIILRAAVEGQPPLDNFIGAALSRVGLADSDWWVRLPAALCGAAGVLLLGLLVGSFAGSVAGVTAALLLAVCPIHLYMSQEARPYALMFVLALASVWTFQAARNCNTKKMWAVFSATVFLMLMGRWTDPHFIVAGIAAYAVVLRRRASQTLKADLGGEGTRFRRTMISLFTAYVLYTPFFVVVLLHNLRAIGAGSEHWSRRTLMLLSEGFAALFAGYSTRTVFNALPGATWLVALAGVCAAAGAWLLFKSARERRDGCGLFLCVFLTFPLFYSIVYGLFGNAVPKPQYLLVGAVVTFGCIAVAVEEIRRRLAVRSPAVGIAAFTVALCAFAVPMVRASLESLERIDKRDWRGVMGYLKDHAGPRDVFAVVATDSVPPGFRVAAYGKARYGLEEMKFLNIDLRTDLAAFKNPGWVRSDNRVWIVGYNDRMYLGRDQLPTPAVGPSGINVHKFNGLFVLELGPGERAVERLMDGLALLCDQTPKGSSFVAGAVLRGGYLLARGKDTEAERSFDSAIAQCSSAEEAAILMGNYITPLKKELAIRAGTGLATQVGP